MTGNDEVRSNVHSVNSKCTEGLDKAKVMAELDRQLRTQTGSAFALFDEIADGDYDLPPPSTADLIAVLKGREGVDSVDTDEETMICTGSEEGYWSCSPATGSIWPTVPATILLVPKDAT